MNQNNNKPKRTFIPQTFGDMLRKVNRNFSSNFSKMEFIIISKWPEIVGAYFLNYSEPGSISKLPKYENEFGEQVYENLLNVNVAPAAALEFQHFKDKIIEKINSYFGYKAIFDLRIQQKHIVKSHESEDTSMNNKELTTEENNLISNKVEGLNNIGLKKSLINLGKNITKENK